MTPVGELYPVPQACAGLGCVRRAVKDKLLEFRACFTATVQRELEIGNVDGFVGKDIFEGLQNGFDVFLL